MADSDFDIAVEVVRHPASLASIVAQWEDLAAHAIEPNPLYEPSTMLPALEAFADDGFRCCLAWARDPERSDLPATLGGLFPFRHQSSYKGFPASALRSWSQSSWTWEPCTPLVRAEGARQHVTALLDRLQRDKVALVEFRQMPCEGAFSGLLAEALRDGDATLFVEELAAPQRASGVSVRNLILGIGTLGELCVSMLPLMNRTKRRIATASRSGSPAISA